MSIGAVSSSKSSSLDLVTQLLLSFLASKISPNAQNGNSIFNTAGYQDPLGTNSIFGATNNLNGTGAMPASNFQSLTSAKEEDMIANLYSSSVTAVLNTRIPPIPTAAATEKK